MAAGKSTGLYSGILLKQKEDGKGYTKIIGRNANNVGFNLQT